MSDIIKFITESPIGVFMSSIIASVIATGLYKLVSAYISKQRKRKQIVKYVSSFCLGARAAQAKSSSYKQILLVGDYLIDILILCTRVVVVSIVALLIVILLKDWYLWGLPIIIACFVTTIDVMKIRSLCKHYRRTVEMIFGKEYLDREFHAAVDSVNMHESNDIK